MSSKSIIGGALRSTQALTLTVAPRVAWAALTEFAFARRSADRGAYELGFN
jgi:hypothetical protein